MHLLLSIALLALPQQATAEQMRSDCSCSPRIVVAGYGQVSVMPDQATISVEVETRSESAAEAADQNALRLSAVLEALQDAGIRIRRLQPPATQCSRITTASASCEATWPGTRSVSA